MKKILLFLMALCLLFAAAAAALATAGFSAALEGGEDVLSGLAVEYEGTQEDTNEPGEAFEGAQENQAGPGEATEPERKSGQPAGFPVTAQQWIKGFSIAAGAQDLELGDGFHYNPGVITGQHVYDFTVAETPAYVIGLSVLSEDGVVISSCSMRMASAMLRSDELVWANDALWRAARAMITGSEPDAGQEDIEALCVALCPDLPAALIRGEQIDSTRMLGSISCSLWACFVEEAFFGDSPTPSDGYIVDFVIQAGAPEEPG